MIYSHFPPPSTLLTPLSTSLCVPFISCKPLIVLLAWSPIFACFRFFNASYPCRIFASSPIPAASFLSALARCVMRLIDNSISNSLTLAFASYVSMLVLKFFSYLLHVLLGVGCHLFCLLSWANSRSRSRYAVRVLFRREEDVSIFPTSVCCSINSHGGGASFSDLVLIAMFAAVLVAMRSSCGPR